MIKFKIKKKKNSEVCGTFNILTFCAVFIQEADCSVHKGSSLLALVELGLELGYQLICTTTWNAIFITNELYPQVTQWNSDGAFDNSLESLHSSTMITELFQTYEGELVLAGPKKMLWHNVPINIQKMQMLSKRDRKFPFSPISYSGHFQKIKEYEVLLVNLCEQYLGSLHDQVSVITMQKLKDSVRECVGFVADHIHTSCLENECVKLLTLIISVLDITTGFTLSCISGSNLSNQYTNGFMGTNVLLDIASILISMGESREYISEVQLCANQ